MHGDDFVAVGERVHIEKFKVILAARFEVKTQLVGKPAEVPTGWGEGERRISGEGGEVWA